MIPAVSPKVSFDLLVERTASHPQFFLARCRGKYLTSFLKLDLSFCALQTVADQSAVARYK
jgi:hypothetical protein